MKKNSIRELIKEGTEVLSIVSTKLDDSITMFKNWQLTIDTTLQELGIPENKISNIKVSMHYKRNKFSEEDSKNKLAEAIQNTIRLLKQLEGISVEVSEVVEFSEAVVLNIIRKILTNFHLHIKEMYQEKVHGNGTFKQENLAKIIIGNEYDVQRMLYSLLRPIFPSARLEVNGDTGYSGMRYDIFLENYDTIIEVKCSRPSMKERNLTEELGADGFNYKAKYLFMFIYDKEIIVKNAEAFKAAFKRDAKCFDKNIEVFILQPISL